MTFFVCHANVLRWRVVEQMYSFLRQFSLFREWTVILRGPVTQVRSLSCASNTNANGNDRKENDAQRPKHAWHEFPSTYIGAVSVVVCTGRGGQGRG